MRPVARDVPGAAGGSPGIPSTRDHQACFLIALARAVRNSWTTFYASAGAAWRVQMRQVVVKSAAGNAVDRGYLALSQSNVDEKPRRHPGRATRCERGKPGI